MSDDSQNISLNTPAHAPVEEALRRSEELFRAIVEDQTEMIVRWKPDGTRTFVNQAYCRVFGKSFEELVGTSFYPLVEKEYQEAIRQKVLSLTPENPTATEIHQSVTPTGQILWQEWTDRGLFDAQGRLVELQSTGRDITERRALEEQLRQAQKMEAIGRLAGGIAHDFNNILAAIMGNAHLATLELEEAHPARARVDAIEVAAARAKALVQQILAFSRRQAPERNVISLKAVIEDASAILKATLPASVDLQVGLAPNAPAVLADATQMQQIILNLATNSWQALEGKPGRITIDLQEAEIHPTEAALVPDLRAGKFAMVTVADTGKGMDAATMLRIYDPFFTTKAVGEGTGLGLSVVHGIVQTHEGAIQVSSHPGAGSVFRVYIPSANGPAEENSDQPAQPGLIAEGHVLCLDDEEGLLLLTRTMLERLGYAVSAFSRPADALMAFRASPDSFDFVITDMNMPGMSGLEVADEILRRRVDMMVTLCSGYITDDLKAEADQLGVFEILHKPFTVKELAACLRRAAAARQTG